MRFVFCLHVARGKNTARASVSGGRKPQTQQEEEDTTIKSKENNNTNQKKTPRKKNKNKPKQCELMWIHVVAVMCCHRGVFACCVVAR
jgi:hypothetical protein